MLTNSVMWVYDVHMGISTSRKNTPFIKLCNQFTNDRSLRYAAGLVGMSHEGLRGWLNGQVPDIAYIIERKNEVAAAYRFLDDAAALLTPSSADLVVAEASE